MNLFEPHLVFCRLYLLRVQSSRNLRSSVVYPRWIHGGSLGVTFGATILTIGAQILIADC